jgi:hypothetical protein
MHAKEDNYDNIIYVHTNSNKKATNIKPSIQ